MANKQLINQLFSSSILPHEGILFSINDVEYLAVRLKLVNLVPIVIIAPSLAQEDVLHSMRSISKWLLRPIENSLKQNSTVTKRTIILLDSSSNIDASESELNDVSVNLISIESSTDWYSHIIISTVDMMLKKLDEVDPSFRSLLSSETERLASEGRFSSTSNGDIRDSLLLSSWLRYRFNGRIGSLSALDLISWDSLDPSVISSDVDGWVDQLFGLKKEFNSINILPVSKIYGDIIKINSGNFEDGLGNFTKLAIGGYGYSAAGDMTSVLEINSNLKYFKNNTAYQPVIRPSGERAPLTEVAYVNLDTSSAVLVKVADGADLIIVEIDSASFYKSRSGEDPIVGFYNQITYEWTYLDDDNNVVRSPVLETPYYSPDLNNASALYLRAFKDVLAEPIPQAAIRTFWLILDFESPVDSAVLEVLIRQKAFMSEDTDIYSTKWPVGSAILEYGFAPLKLNFASWHPTDAQRAVFKIDVLNHRLWDIDPTDASNESALTQNFQGFPALKRNFLASLKYSA